MKFFFSFLIVLLGGNFSTSVLLPAQNTIDFLLQPIPEIHMLAFGDLILDRDVKKFMKEQSEDYPFEKIFGPGGIHRKDFDIVNANLEGPIYDSPSRVDLFPQFAFDPTIAPQLLKKWGFTLLNLANNHTWDKGVKGWESTLKSLHDVGISTVGHPKNHFDTDTYETTIHGIKIGFIAMEDVLKIFPIDWEAAKKKVQELKSRNQFVVLIIHWGREFQTHSSQHQEEKAHEMIDGGVDLIIGHHPHVVEESEEYKGKKIYYSLGNFVFDQYFSKEVQQGLGLDIRLQLGGKIDVKEIPFVIEKGQPRLGN